MHDIREFLIGLVEQARANVPDCRLDYVELQLDKDNLDELAAMHFLAPIDWHPEPCKHEGTRWVKTP